MGSTNNRLHSNPVLSNRKITILNPNNLNRNHLLGNEVITHYKHAEPIHAHQIELLRRLLPRTLFESFFASTWLKRRVECNIPLKREELKFIIRTASQQPINWDNLLGDTINLAEPHFLRYWLLEPIYQWWLTSLAPSYPMLKNELIQLQVHINQLKAQSEFWAITDTKLVNKSSIQQDIEQKKRLSLNQERDYQHKIHQIEQTATQMCPNWFVGIEQMNQQINLTTFMVVPDNIRDLWLLLIQLVNGKDVSVLIHDWLYVRHLCLENDSFYWCSD
ncbi:T3SS regulon anti-activator ExsD domain-containing protein [Arsenophonus sp.]|uniref:T3SS regulon anti-activator ExsD domain-containing protein n=1 Tax=Arsenophonus sp. TaxID=1872640 RepID=UPI00285B7F3F|nr:T3SS regulon anti-activator ExsD domain-containing protein [Arsenophonus sp.]MDR5617678.1 T3SS regulon anti-activator ExsD family protein [Arsenophonus sp.]